MGTLTRWAAIGVLVTGIVVGLGLAVRALDPTAGANCGERELLPSRTSPTPLRLKVPIEPRRVVYADARGVKNTVVFAEVQGSLTGLEEDFATGVLVGEPRLAHVASKRSFPSSLIVATGEFSNADEGVNVNICTDLAPGGDFEAGTYQGSVRITDDRFSTDPINLIIEIKDRSWYYVLLATIVGGVLGTTWGSASMLVATWDNKPTQHEKKIRRAMIRRLLILSLAFGTAAGCAYYLFDYVDASSFEAKWRTRRDIGAVVFAWGMSMAPVIAVLERVWRNVRPAGANDTTAGDAPAPEPVDAAEPTAPTPSP